MHCARGKGLLRRRVGLRLDGFRPRHAEGHATDLGPFSMFDDGAFRARRGCAPRNDPSAAAAGRRGVGPSLDLRRRRAEVWSKALLFCNSHHTGSRGLLSHAKSKDLGQGWHGSKECDIGLARGPSHTQRLGSRLTWLEKCDISPACNPSQYPCHPCQWLPKSTLDRLVQPDLT